jgi:hypothetical protein
MNTLLLGVSKTDITPPVGGELLGYAVLESTGVIEPLMAKAMVLSNENKTVAIITCDLLGISGDITAAVRKGIAKKSKLIRCEDIMICASHTHGGPSTMTNYHTDVGHDKPYLKRLVNNLVDVVCKAEKNLEPVTWGLGSGKATFNINRRLPVNGDVLLAPNPKGVCDHEVQVVRFDTLAGKTKGILFNFTCHATVMGGSKIHADYPGAAKTVVEKECPGAMAFFTNGACGNVRPMFKPRNAKTFGGGTPEAIKKAGDMLGKEVLRVAKKIKTNQTSDIRTISKVVRFPLEKTPTIPELQREIKEHQNNIRTMKSENKPLPFILQENQYLSWCKTMLKRATNKTLHPWLDGEMQLFKIGNLILVGLPGEIFCEYGLAIKKLCKPATAMIAGFTNECLAYFPTAKAIREGGFEPYSYKGYGFPSRFSEKIESVFLNSIETLYRKLNPSQKR